jgi:small-conductance mechanosensitive channel
VKKFLEYDIVSFSHYHLTVYHLVFLSLVFLIVRIILSFINGVLKRQVTHGHLDEGSRYAVYQIVKYIVFVLGLTVGLESVGVDITILVAGSAALLVGIGLGLQQVFFDLVSGIIILFERTIKVGDIIEVGTRKGTIQSINIRTSHIMTKEGVLYIIPNSKFLSDAVVNWSNESNNIIEFSVRTRVAYGTNLELATKLIKDIAERHPQIEKAPAPQVRLVDFGPDSLILDLEFFTKERYGVGDIQSDVRFEVEKAFTANEIKIPFPKTHI